MLNDHEKLLIIDFGGPEKTSVARAVRGAMVYSEVAGPTITADEIRDKGYRAIILCGRPTLEHMEAKGGVRPGIPFDKTIADLDLPILAFGFAGRVMTQLKRGQVAIPGDNEDGAWDAPAEKQVLRKIQDAPMLMGLPDEIDIWTSSPYFIKEMPEGFTALMGNEQMPHAFSGDLDRGHYIADFQTRLDDRVLRLIIGNFLCMVSQFRGDWDMQRYMLNAIDELKQQCEGKRALLALSGGVDSSVVAMLAHKALGPRLHAVFVDHGLMRLNEGDWIEEIFKNMGLNLLRINAQDRFLGKLAGVSDPEKKRKIIGEEFIRVFEEEARKADCDFLLQGTIYPDVIESGIGGHKVKSHHNVGGLPEDIEFEAVLEPLRPLYKDEVRQLGLLLGLPSKLVNRQPFPGPGLGVRCLGEVKKEKLDILRQADHIWREEIEKAGLNKDLGQYFAAIMDSRAVGTSKTGERTFNETIALRAVHTTDYMEADFAQLPWELLEHCSSRIYNEVEGVGRVLYDISSKPPATIEWE